MLISNLSGKFGWIAYYERVFGKKRFNGSLFPSLLTSSKHIAVLSSSCEKFSTKGMFIRIKGLVYRKWIFPFTYEFSDTFNDSSIGAIDVPEKNVYFMDAASIVVSYLLSVDQNSTILDTCSAPGGKALIISKRILDIIESNGLIQPNCRIICNEFSRSRFERLNKVLLNHIGKNNMNLIDLKTILADATNSSILSSLPSSAKFSRILIDAPCSSDRHLILHNNLQKWSIKSTKENFRRQVDILKNSFKLLEDKGIILYCTCSLSEIENDATIEHLCKNKNLNADSCMDSFIKAVQEFNSTYSQIRISIKPITEEYRRIKFDKCVLKIDSLENEETLEKETYEITFEYSKFGAYILPDKNNGIGPLYIAFIEKSTL